MSVFYVFQGKTYKEERCGGYVWAPQLAKKDKNNKQRKNNGYTTMTKVHKADYILHNDNGYIRAISVAKNDCYSAQQPQELINARKTIDWNADGYRVDTEYYDLDKPLNVRAYKTWLVDHYVEGSAFTIIGTGKQQYMSHIADEHAAFLLWQAIKIQSDKNLIEILNSALNSLKEDESPAYSEEDIDAINAEIERDDGTSVKPEWSGTKQAQILTVSESSGKIKLKRDQHRAAQALRRADYLCEYDPTDKTFLRKNGKPYTEPHHLIPISKYLDFEYSVDVMENIVSLCSNCHNLLHYGRIEDKEKVLKKLYADREKALDTCGIPVSFEQLMSYYK